MKNTIYLFLFIIVLWSNNGIIAQEEGRAASAAAGSDEADPAKKENENSEEADEQQEAAAAEGVDKTAAPQSDPQPENDNRHVEEEARGLKEEEEAPGEESPGKRVWGAAGGSASGESHDDRNHEQQETIQQETAPSSADNVSSETNPEASSSTVDGGRTAGSMKSAKAFVQPGDSKTASPEANAQQQPDNISSESNQEVSSSIVEEDGRTKASMASAKAFVQPGDSSTNSDKPGTPHVVDTGNTTAASSAMKTPSSKTTTAFLVSKQKAPSMHNPPEGYTVTARVYIDPKDRLTHFDKQPLRIPYWDCGYTGSTTSPLPLKGAYFRHALTGATSWTGTDGKHAVLAIALTPLAIDLNSGETQDFEPGSVILLEDVLLPGHKMRPLLTNHGVSILFLTLPDQHTHTGRDHLSLPPSLLKRKKDPCPNDHPEGTKATFGGEAGRAPGETISESSSGSGSGSGAYSSLDEILSAPQSSSTFTLTPRQVRRMGLAIIGMSLSSLAADFLGKTAPLWLAVGVGGTCFVAGGTWAFTALGDALWTFLQVALERKRLKVNQRTDEEEDKQETIEEAPPTVLQ